MKLVIKIIIIYFGCPSKIATFTKEIRVIIRFSSGDNFFKFNLSV